ncbi:hypothetical protein ES703_43158 [subsurface metagenome]
MIARADPDFYLGVWLSSFEKNGNWYILEEVLADMPSDERKKVSTIIALQKRCKTISGFGKVLSFLHHVGIIYVIAQGPDPKQYMGITGRGIADEPALRKELQWVSQGLLPIGDAIDNGDWKEAGRLMQPHILSIACSCRPGLEATAGHIKGLADEFFSRIEGYDEQECKSLLQKTLDSAYLIECSAALTSSTLPEAMRESLSALWSKSMKHLPKVDAFSETELGKVKAKFKQLCTLNPKYQAANRRFEEKQVQNQIAQKVNENKAESDRIEHFFNLFANCLREHDFFVDKNVSKKLAPDLANLYLELDNKLLKGEPPFSENSPNVKDLTSLISSLTEEGTDFLLQRLNRQFEVKPLKGYITVREATECIF